MLLNYGVGGDFWEFLELQWRSNQSILKEISAEYSLEGLMLKLKLTLLWPSDVKNWLIWKKCRYWERLNVVGEGDDRGWGGWMASPTWWIWVWVNSRTEKAMAPHSSTLAWKIPWTEEPGRLQSMGSVRVGHDWATSLSLFTFMHWRRKWQATPVFLPGESQGWGSLVGCHLWGCTESDTTEVT